MLCLAMKLELNSISLEIPNMELMVCFMPSFRMSHRVRNDLLKVLAYSNSLLHSLKAKERKV